MTDAYFFMVLTLFAYWGGIVLIKKVRLNSLPPLIPALAFLLLVMIIFRIPYSQYMRGGQYIHFWLSPATVTLGLALFRQKDVLVRNLKPVLLAGTAGTLTALLSTVALSRLLGLDSTLTASMLTKSVTTPVALAISEDIGGIPALAAAMVVITGNIGGVIGLQLLTAIKVKSPVARGMAMGTSAHALGTATALRENETAGALSGVALIVAAILTAILVPAVMHFL